SGGTAAEVAARAGIGFIRGGGTMSMDERRAERLTSETLVHSRKQGNRRSHICRNISRLGCMIADDGLSASTGDDLDIELVDGVVVPARVIWARQGHLGLAFKREINPATVRFLAAVDQAGLEDVGLRDRFGRLLPDRFGQHAA
ncbi:PilZ domain-containing protein, partial [Parasphingorhabdus sp.]|uniref:PilZ domain-containing protein n=1 Tax=Parasphingorhabdus sp. TaxID=2709688 RepID=UPI0035936307